MRHSQIEINVVHISVRRDILNEITSTRYHSLCESDTVFTGGTAEGKPKGVRRKSGMNVGIKGGSGK